MADKEEEKIEWNESKIDLEEYKRLKEERDRLLREKEKLETEIKTMRDQNTRLAAEKRRLEAERKTEELKNQQQQSYQETARQPTAQQYNVGGKIQFGRYPFYEDGGEKQIEWIILDKDSEGNALLISKYGLDAKRFDASSNNWERSEIRQWLNNDFLNKAFNAEEKGLILRTNTECLKKGSILKSNLELYDDIFLLSIEEANKYFKNDNDRKAYPTPYAKGRGAYIYGGSCWWWLRSPGYGQLLAATVDTDGSVYSYGLLVYNDYRGVRAALKINLNNL